MKSYKAKQPLPFVKRFLSQLGKGLFRDVIKVGSVFVILFMLMMLHLTKTVEIPPLTWLFGAVQQQTENALPPQLDVPLSGREQHVPDLLP